MTRVSSPDASASSARAALESQLARYLADLPMGDPFRPGVMRWAQRTGRPADAAPLLRHWTTRAIGGPQSNRRYRWDLLPFTPHLADLADRPGFWRPRERELARSEPVDFALRLLVPIVVADSSEYLAEVAALPDRVASDVAGMLLLEAAPTIDNDLAELVMMRDPWRDTFALWLAARRPFMLERHHPLLVALASRYAVAARATAGIVSSRKFPFEGEPLTSASAHLATGLLVLGVYPSLLPSLVSFVASEQRPEGGWGDPHQPSDLLTSLAAADLLSHLDPDFEPESITRFLDGSRDADGAWRAYGPEVPWLAAELMSLLDELDRPFVERFRWPHVVRWSRDRHTGLAGYAYFADLVRFFGDLDLLRKEPLEVAYLDLAGFGNWNNAHGMEAGDDVLRLVGECLSAIPGAVAIRDGGDEFIVVGAPRRTGLRRDLDEFRMAWPRRFAARFGDGLAPVPPRLVTSSVPAGQLALARDRLSKALGSAKERHPRPEAVGVIEQLEPVGS